MGIMAALNIREPRIVHTTKINSKIGGNSPSY